jgi:hypothetical protein
MEHICKRLTEVGSTLPHKHWTRVQTAIAYQITLLIHNKALYEANTKRGVLLRGSLKWAPAFPKNTGLGWMWQTTLNYKSAALITCTL